MGDIFAWRLAAGQQHRDQRRECCWSPHSASVGVQPEPVVVPPDAVDSQLIPPIIPISRCASGYLPALPPEAVPRVKRKMLNDHAGRPGQALSAFQVGERECRRGTAP